MSRRRILIMAVATFMSLGVGAASAVTAGPVSGGTGVHHAKGAPMIQYCVQPHATVMDIKIVDLPEICIPPDAPHS